MKCVAQQIRSVEEDRHCGILTEDAITIWDYNQLVLTLIHVIERQLHPCMDDIASEISIDIYGRRSNI